MKFTVLPNVLKAAVVAISPALSTKNAMPILDNILFTPSSDFKRATLTASNGDFTIVTQMELMEQENLVNALLPAKNIREFVSRALSVFPVSFDYNQDSGEWTLTDDFGEFRFISETSVSLFPSTDSDLPEGSFSIALPASILLDAMNAARGFASSDDLRPVMNGVYLDFSPNGLNIVSSDSKTLFREIISSVVSHDRKSVIVPQKMVTSLKSLFQISSDAEIMLSFDEKNVCFAQGDTFIRGSLIEGRYPRYEAVIPKNNDLVADVDVSKLMSAVSRASLSANSSTNQVCLEFDGASNLVLSANDIDFSTSSKTTIQTISQKGLKDFRVGVKASILCSCLGIFKSSNILLTFSDPRRAIVIRSSSSDRIALLMPMALQD